MKGLEQLHSDEKLKHLVGLGKGSIGGSHLRFIKWITITSTEINVMFCI